MLLPTLPLYKVRRKDTGERVDSKTPFMGYTKEQENVPSEKFVGRTFYLSFFILSIYLEHLTFVKTYSLVKIMFCER